VSAGGSLLSILLDLLGLLALIHLLGILVPCTGHRLVLLAAARGGFLLLALGRFRLLPHNASLMGFLDGWKYCPRCAEPLTRTTEWVECASCGLRVFAHSQPGAEAVCFDDAGRILLGRRAAKPREGYWDLPGGFVHEGELPVDGMRREVEEETGQAPEPVELLGMWNEPYLGRDVLCLTWIARLAGDVQPGDDIAELRWFEPGELPWDDLAFTHYADALSLAVRRYPHA
jgi:ADP-ribose pyrophosphatase YjhB (NUDIX family)